MTNAPFQTPRLTIRRWVPDDAEAALKIYGNPAVTRFIGDGIQQPDVPAMRTRLVKVIRKAQESRYRFGSWALFEKRNGRLVGAVLLKPLAEDQKIEVGWHLAEEAWGKGFATESAKAACRYGFEDLELDAIYAVVRPENTRSLRVAQRLGMKYEGLTSRYYDTSLDLYSLRQQT